MDEADRLCDRITIIDYGKMLVTDSPENLKRKYGKGDNLEIHYSGTPVQLTDIENLADETMLKESVMIFKSRAIIDRIPVILESLKKSGVNITGMHLSENTLEDVFISLTGRKLRE
jgi:ABC-2 type transport system ATP-binding protein